MAGRPTFEEVARFHGHVCPGLALGYRMAVAALDALGVERAEDEELVAIVENDACGVDAVQYLAGCTFGKGNLVFRDHGKHVYTLLSRRSGRAVRVVGHLQGAPPELREERAAYIQWILQAPLEALVSLREVQVEHPPLARIRSSAPCARCGERVMETRLRSVNGRLLCIPCAEEEQRAGDVHA
ncbi:MAG: FmdE family protein [Candidatus Bipolaricaulota bacterium]|nr:TraR/DksA C4-type zinc finger protein [Candidatus Bipolaricaulota bacterium]